MIFSEIRLQNRICQRRWTFRWLQFVLHSWAWQVSQPTKKTIKFYAGIGFIKDLLEDKVNAQMSQLNAVPKQINLHILAFKEPNWIWPYVYIIDMAHSLSYHRIQWRYPFFGEFPPKTLRNYFQNNDLIASMTE